MCNEYEELLLKALDENLTEEENKQWVAHLKQCETCREDFEQLQAIKEKLGKIEEAEVPAGFHEELMTKIQKEQPKTPFMKHIIFKWQKVGLIAACFLGFGIFIYQINHFENEKSKGMSEMASMEKAVASDEGAPEEAPEEAFGAALQSEEEEKKSDLKKSADAAMIVTRWEITVSDETAFKKACERYLTHEGITYQEENNKLWVDESVNLTELEQWIKDEGGEVVKQEETGEQSAFILQFKSFNP